MNISIETTKKLKQRRGLNLMRLTASIKNRILVLQFLIVLIAFLVFGIFNILTVRGIVENKTTQAGQALVLSSAQRIGTDFASHISEINIMTNSKEIQSGDLELGVEYLGKNMKDKKIKDLYEMLIIANSTGECQTHDGEKVGKTNIKERPYFIDVMSGNSDFVVSQPVISKVSGKLVVVIALPIRVNGQIKGMVGGTIICDSLTEKVKNIKMGATSYCYIVQDDGLIVIHPDKDFVRELNIAKKDYYLDAEKKVKTKKIASDSLIAAGESILASENGVKEYTLDNIEKFAFYNLIPNTTLKLILTIPKSDMYKETDRLTQISVLIFIISIAIAMILLYVMMTSALSPINRMTKLLNAISKGDLSTQVPEELIRRRDEIGIMANSLKDMQRSVKDMISTIFNTTKNLESSSKNLIQVAGVMGDTSKGTGNKSRMVKDSVSQITLEISHVAEALTESSSKMKAISSSIEGMTSTICTLAFAAEQTSSGVGNATQLVVQISDGINTVSHSAREVSTSVLSVVTAIKEINVSLNEINKNCERSMTITRGASSSAEDTNSVIKKLSESSKQIGKIVSVINDIADQTNMLALNAAIEAAGAGESGKGFAVVANEVKELAKQTAEATDEISQQIENMQNDMTVAVKAVRNFTDVIVEITSITSTIASAVTQQSATIGEISGSAVMAGDKVSLISKNISDIANDYQAVSKSIKEASNGAHEIAKSASELSTASNGIAENTEKASGNVSDMANASQRISKGASEILVNIEEIGNTADEVSKRVSETSSAAKIIADEAKELDGLVKRFKI